MPEHVHAHCYTRAGSMRRERPELPAGPEREPGALGGGAARLKAGAGAAMVH